MANRRLSVARFPATPTEPAININIIDNGNGTVSLYVDDGLAQYSAPITAAGVPVAGVGGGDVFGPAGSTDNAIARFDGITGKLLQNSPATLSDSGELVTAALTSSNGQFNSVDLNGLNFGGYTFLDTVGGGYRGAYGRDPDGVYADPTGVKRLFVGFPGSNANPLLCTRLVVPKATTPIAVSQIDDNRKAFTNEGAAAQIVFNLPAAVAGLEYTFIVQDADGIQIVAAAGDTINLAGTVSAAAGNATSTTPGSSITLLAINATEWVAISALGTWIIT